MLFNACMQVGYHPREWRDARVVVIPIPAKPYYSQPKAHRPIALLECLGELQEKVVTKRLLFEFTTQELIPTTQFGGRNASSCLDAAFTLFRDVDAAYANKLKCCILLFASRVSSTT